MLLSAWVVGLLAGSNRYRRELSSPYPQQYFLPSHKSLMVAAEMYLQAGRQTEICEFLDAPIMTHHEAVSSRGFSHIIFKGASKLLLLPSDGGRKATIQIRLGRIPLPE